MLDHFVFRCLQFSNWWVLARWSSFQLRRVPIVSQYAAKEPLTIAEITQAESVLASFVGTASPPDYFIYAKKKVAEAEFILMAKIPVCFPFHVCVSAFYNFIFSLDIQFYIHFGFLPVPVSFAKCKAFLCTDLSIIFPGKSFYFPSFYYS